MDNVAIRYSQAMFDLALEVNELDSFLSDLKVVSSILRNDDESCAFFKNPRVKKTDKKIVLEASFSNAVGLYVLNTLKLLIDHGRFDHLQEIVLCFTHLYNKHNNIKEGILYTAFALNKSEETKIRAALEEKLNAKVELTTKIDRSLIGGVKVVIGNEVIDGTIANRIDSLKHELLQGR